MAVVGASEFVVGFQLAGIKDIIEVGKDPFNDLKSLKGKKDVGIVVIDGKIMDELDSYKRLEIESSVDPVFIPLSAKSEQDSLRNLIKKSIGVDLWK